MRCSAPCSVGGGGANMRVIPGKNWGSWRILDEEIIKNDGPRGVGVGLQ